MNSPFSTFHSPLYYNRIRRSCKGSTIRRAVIRKFGVSEDWIDWREAAKFNPESLRYRHTVTMFDSSKMEKRKLRLENGEGKMNSPFSTFHSPLYYHWSPKPVKLRKLDYPQSGHPKPHGLWFDVNEDWKCWCDATQFNPEGLRYRHTVTILDSSRILFLQKAREIDAFTKKYGRNLSCNVQFLQRSEDLGAIAWDKGRNFLEDVQKAFSSYILWNEVAEKHSGIIISPYSRSRSQTYLWYWGWNCAAGCIWDTSIIRLGKPCKMVE